MANVQEVRNSIIAEATKKHEKYPQYAGHWDGFKLVRVKKNIRTKMGIAFVKGEVSIAQDATKNLLPKYAEEVAGCVSVYSKRNSIDTLIDAKNIEWLE